MGPRAYPGGEVYEPSRPEEAPGCRDVWVITRATLGVLVWPLLALIAVLLSVFGAFVLFATHPALALLPIAALVAAVYLFARWEQRRSGPPDA